uniref:Uncharacterized protein n=1 Tax=Timema genevievae TaxID=629358 RepID=A0A7R9PR80_TIMGE|nr:unnamed protein product [Timema genevievae]
MKEDTAQFREYTGRMFLVGLATGPPQHIFYKVLDGCIPRRDFRSISMKILIDQLVASPMCLLIFFFGMGYLELRNYQCIVDEMKEKFITIYTVRRVENILSTPNRDSNLDLIIGRPIYCDVTTEAGTPAEQLLRPRPFEEFTGAKGKSRPLWWVSVLPVWFPVGLLSGVLRLQWLAVWVVAGPVDLVGLPFCETGPGWIGRFVSTRVWRSRGLVDRFEAWYLDLKHV